MKIISIGDMLYRIKNEDYSKLDKLFNEMSKLEIEQMGNYEKRSDFEQKEKDVRAFFELIQTTYPLFLQKIDAMYSGEL